MFHRMVKALVCLLFFCACENRYRGKIYNEQFKDFDLNVSDVKSFEVPQTIPVEFQVPDSGITLPIDSFISGVEYIPLQTIKNSFIGKVSSILTTIDRYIIIDKEIAKAIFIFDKKGKFISEISSPQYARTFSAISYAGLDYSEKKIIIFDNKLSKQFYYDLTGNLIKEVKVGFRYNNFAYLNDKTTVRFTNDLQNDHQPEIDNFSLLITEGEHDIMFKGFYIDPVFEDFPLFAESHFFFHDKKLLFFPRFSDTVFMITQKGLTIPLYRLKTNNLMPVSFLMNDLNRKMFRKKITQTNFQYYCGNFFENSTHIFTTLMGGQVVGGANYIVVNKASKVAFKINELQLLTRGVLSSPGFNLPLAVDRDRFIGVLYPSKLVKYDNFRTNSKGALKFTPSLDSLKMKINKSANPILVIYKFEI